MVRQIFTNHDPRAIAAKETTELLPPLGKAFSEENYVVRLEGHVETWTQCWDGDSGDEGTGYRIMMDYDFWIL